MGGALSGDAVVRGRSLFANRVGESVASTFVSLFDDPTDARHFAASSHDGEGLACRHNAAHSRRAAAGLRVRHLRRSARRDGLNGQRPARRDGGLALSGLSGTAAGTG